MDVLKIITCALAVLILRLPTAAQEKPLKYSAIHIGLVYPVSTHGTEALSYSNRFSAHAFAGLSGAERGVALAGFALIVKDSATGLQAAGFLNSTGTSQGVAMAGFINVSGNAGTQLGGFMNIAKDVKGVQAAGFLNLAKKVKGVQIAGFLNIADSSDYPIGLVNIIHNGEKSIGLSTDETLTNLVTFRSGGRKLYGILGAGYNGHDKKDLYAWEGGLGAHFQLAHNCRLNTELVSIGLTDFKSGDYFRSSLRVLPAIRLSRQVEFFAGPTFNYIRSEKDKGAGLVTHYVWSEREPSGLLHGLYFGATGGMSILF